MTDGALKGLIYCGNVLIPSLFPFMFLTIFIIKSNLSDTLSMIFKPLTLYLFRLPCCCGAPLLLSMFGGYPIGAKSAANLLKQGKITQEQAKHMALCAVGGGPAFAIFAVGGSLLHNTTIGLIIYLSQLLAQLIICALWALFYPIPDYIKSNSTISHKSDFSASIVESCSDAVACIIQLCGLVVLFSAVWGIIESAGGDVLFGNLLCKVGVTQSTAYSLLPCIWEVTCGCCTAAGNGAPACLSAFAIGFGGLCVHFQIYSVARTIKIQKLLFTFYRFVQGMLAAAFTAAALAIYPIPLTVWANTPFSSCQSTTYWGSFALVVMMIFFLLSVKWDLLFSKKYHILSKST